MVVLCRARGTAQENSPSGLWRTLGKRVGCKPSGVRIPHPPLVFQRLRRSLVPSASLLAVDVHAVSALDYGADESGGRERLAHSCHGHLDRVRTVARPGQYALEPGARHHCAGRFEQLAEYGEPDAIIYNAGRFPANRRTHGMTSKTSIDIDLNTRELVILGTEYAGEMKKGVFTLMNYFGPKQGILSMHCSATADRETGRASVLFGLSGTGKTTLSADPNRMLIGDDEHCWSDRGIFNIEGGCYAKAVDLTPESEPEIFQALRFGAVLENVVYDQESHHVDFHDTRITQNTRGAYPIEFIRNAQIPCIAGHPTDAIFLTCDAFGVLPPVSRLSPEQAMYHFISGYTAKVAGTEMGVTEPQATFSPCFGGPFLVWHPAKYAELLAEKLRQHNVNVWLVNTG